MLFVLSSNTTLVRFPEIWFEVLGSAFKPSSYGGADSVLQYSPCEKVGSLNTAAETLVMNGLAVSRT